MEQGHVKVRIRFKDGDETLPPGERLWARPVDAHDGGGTYELLNSSLFVPLAVRDLVRAEPDGDGMLQVTGLVERPGAVPERIDFRLEGPSSEPVTTSYWAPDDPFWREHGLDSPDFLAYVQFLAGEDELIAAALERGEHELVGEMLAFLNDGPLW